MRASFFIFYRIFYSFYTSIDEHFFKSAHMGKFHIGFYSENETMKMKFVLFVNLVSIEKLLNTLLILKSTYESPINKHLPGSCTLQVSKTYCFRTWLGLAHFIGDLLLYLEIISIKGPEPIN